MDKLSGRVDIVEIDRVKEEIYSILLLADPSENIVNEYIKRGKVFIAKIEDNVVGAYVLIYTRPETIEIVNIAVKEEWQGKGIGKVLLEDAIKKSKDLGAKVLDIGTGNSSIYQLALYQKVGFRIVSVDRDFFIKHYKEEIYENGIRCIDMIRLSMDLG